MSIKDKLTSRKFWMSVMTLAAGFGTAFHGIDTGNDIMTIVGIACGAGATFVYTVAEAIIDAIDRKNAGGGTSE